jgi:hypothetical protein
MIKNKFFTALMFTTAISTAAFSMMPNLSVATDETAEKSRLTTTFNQTEIDESKDDARDQLVSVAVKLTVEKEALLAELSAISKLVSDTQTLFASLSHITDGSNVFSSDATLLAILTRMFAVTTAEFKGADELQATLEQTTHKLNAAIKELKAAQTEAAKVAQLTTDLDAANLEAAKVAQLTTDLDAAKLEAAKVAQLTTDLDAAKLEAAKVADLLSNQSLLQARIDELAKQISESGATVSGTAPVIAPVSPIVVSSVSTNTSLVVATEKDVTFSNGNLKITDDQYTEIRSARATAAGRGAQSIRAQSDEVFNATITVEYAMSVLGIS